MNTYFKSSMYVKPRTEKLAYRFWYLVGSHHAYLGKWFNQMVLWALLLAWVPVVLFPNFAFFQQYLGVFAIGLPALAVLWLVADLILIPYYVKKANERQRSVLRTAKRIEHVQLEEPADRIGYPITY